MQVDSARSLLFNPFDAPVVELVDTADLKSAGPRSCGFESRPGY